MATKEKIAVCPGTFDPITYGHIDLVQRALKLFDTVIVAVSSSYPKLPMFSVEERTDMVKKTIGKTKRVIVKSFDGLVVDFARKEKASALIRGVRMLSDFEYEFQMALTNKKLNSQVETIFLMPDESYAYLTSRLMKEVTAMGGNLADFVPQYVLKKLMLKMSEVRR